MDEVCGLTVCLGQGHGCKDKVMEPNFFISWWRLFLQPNWRKDKAGQNAHCASQPHTRLAPGAEDRLSCLTANAHHRAKRNETLGSRQCQTSRGYYWGLSGSSCVVMRQSNYAKRLECVQLAPAFGAATLNGSASELDALQPLRVTAMPIFPYVYVFRAAHARPTRMPALRQGLNRQSPFRVVFTPLLSLLSPVQLCWQRRGGGADNGISGWVGEVVGSF
jgi:hypothetical protein